MILTVTLNPLLERRLQIILLSSLESSYVSLTLESKGMNAISKKLINRSLVILPLSEVIKYFFLDSTKDNAVDIFDFSSNRYIPEWQNLFLYNCNDVDRITILTQQGYIDDFIDNTLSPLRNSNIMDSYQAILPIISFLEMYLTQLYLKYVHFLYLENKSLKIESPIESVLYLQQEIYSKGISLWNDSIIKTAQQQILDKGDLHAKITGTFSPIKLIPAILNILKEKIDSHILNSQIIHYKAIIGENLEIISNIKPGHTLISKADIPYMSLNRSKVAFSISPIVADSQFSQEISYSHSFFVLHLEKLLKT